MTFGASAAVQMRNGKNEQVESNTQMRERATPFAFRQVPATLSSGANATPVNGGLLEAAALPSGYFV